MSSIKQFLLGFIIFVISSSAFATYYPGTGRFLNRDPIAEKGGNNLYAFVKNNPIDNWDKLGLSKYILIYDVADKTGMFLKWKEYIKEYIKHNRYGTTIFGNSLNFDKKCDEIIEVKATSHSAIEKILKTTKNIAYIGSFGHGGAGKIWYNKPSIAYGIPGSLLKDKTSKIKSLAAWKTPNLTKNAFVELYHCYTRETFSLDKQKRALLDPSGTTSVAGYLQSILGVPVYGTKGAINNGWWYNRGYPRLRNSNSSSTDKNPNSGGSGGSIPISS